MGMDRQPFFQCLDLGSQVPRVVGDLSVVFEAVFKNATDDDRHVGDW